MMVSLKDFCFAQLEGDIKSRIGSGDSKKKTVTGTGKDI